MFDGMIYRNGETFQPSCKYQCTCRDGQIGCLPRCNLDLLLPGPDCPFPRKVEVPGECCEKWICDPKDEVILGGFAMAGEETKAYNHTEREGDTLGISMGLHNPKTCCFVLLLFEFSSSRVTSKYNTSIKVMNVKVMKE